MGQIVENAKTGARNMTSRFIRLLALLFVLGLVAPAPAAGK
jgi:hypothetical protein